MSRPDNSSAQNAWSRRRAGVQAEAAQEQAQEQAQAKAVARADLETRQADRSDAEILAELNLKDPDQMQAGDDFAAFLHDRVPAHLRKRALRILWRSNPVLACVDDLVDYGNDFKAEALEVDVVKTAYRVGKGMLAHCDEMEKQRAEKLLQNPEKDAAEDCAPVLAKDDKAEPEAPEEREAEAAREPEQPDDQSPYHHKRRMRFDFEGAA